MCNTWPFLWQSERKQTVFLATNRLWVIYVDTSSWHSSVSLPAIRRYGKDFAAIAEVIGTKTPAQVSILFLKGQTRGKKPCKHHVSHLIFWPHLEPPPIQPFTFCKLPISFSSPLPRWLFFLYRISIISIIPPFICLLTSSLRLCVLERSTTVCPPFISCLSLHLCLSAQVSSFFVSYRRRFNLDEVLREWAAEQVATNRDQRDPRRSSEETAGATDGAAEEEEVSHNREYTWYMERPEQNISINNPI